MKAALYGKVYGISNLKNINNITEKAVTYTYKFLAVFYTAKNQYGI